MGNIKDDWLAFKQEGNEYFKQNQMKEAVEAYSKGIDVCESDADKIVLFKNRSACYLKLNKFEEAIVDADAVLLVHPRDVKALFRRCQANEALGNVEPAYKDAKVLIQLEPKNNAIQEMYRILNFAVQEIVNKRHSTSGMINEMMESIQNPKETAERKKQALTNLIIYSHQSGGRDVLLKGGYLLKLIPVLSASAEKCQYFMKICHGFSENSFQQSLMVLKLVTEEKLKELILQYAGDLDFITAALSFITECIKSMANHFKEVHKLAPEHEGNNWYIRESLQNVKESLERIPQYKNLLQLLVVLLTNKSVPADVRDVVIDAYTKAFAFHKAIADFVIGNRGVVKLIELASTSVYPMMKKEAPLPVNADTYYHVSVALAGIYDNLNYDQKSREKFEEQAEGIIKILLTSENPNAKLQGLIAMSTLIMANREAGNIICNKNDSIQKVITITDEGDLVAEKIGGEVLALAATDKDICKILAGAGLPLLRKLYQSKDNDVRVRGLVSLCKVCMKGSGDAKDQILADGGNSKLYNSCRKFLMSDKTLGLKKWAVEGLAYLTLDADVKEMLVNDAEALNGLIELAKSGDNTVTYSVVGTFVNLTNSYDKPEKNPELEEVAKFAKHHVPEQHEKDSDEYAENRLTILVNNGLVSALVNFGEVKSKYSNEMIARVFGAIVNQVPYRGRVVAEGGVKCLLTLCANGTEKGIDIAAQALAKIAITADPRLAFSGQRCMEVVRPLVRLLNFKREPLHRFEALMALTNLASMNDDVRRRIMKEKAFHEIETLMFEEDDDFRRAATECMCNLVQNEQAFNKFKETDAESDRLKLVTMFCGEEPAELSSAAAGTLAILTSDVEICRRILEYKPTLDILKFLTLNENLAVRHRGLYIVANMIQSEKAIAEILVKDNVFDILMAYSVSNAGNEMCKKELDRSIAALRKLKLIEQNPDK